MAEIKETISRWKAVSQEVKDLREKYSEYQTQYDSDRKELEQFKAEWDEQKDAMKMAVEQGGKALIQAEEQAKRVSAESAARLSKLQARAAKNKKHRDLLDEEVSSMQELEQNCKAEDEETEAAVANFRESRDAARAALQKEIEETHQSCVDLVAEHEKSVAAMRAKIDGVKRQREEEVDEWNDELCRRRIETRSVRLALLQKELVRLGSSKVQWAQIRSTAPPSIMVDVEADLSRLQQRIIASSN